MANDNEDVKAPDFAANLDPQIVDQIVNGMVASQAKPTTQLQSDVKQAQAAQKDNTPVPSLDAGSSMADAQSGKMFIPPDLVQSMSAGQKPPMPQGGVPSDQSNQVPRPTIGGLPGLIADLIHPGRGVVAGQPIPSKAERFEGFLTNFLQAMSQGLAGEGRGPGAAMRGFGIAMQAPYQQALQQYGLQQQQRQQEAQLEIERQKANALTPSIDVEGPKGESLRISPSQLPQYLLAGYRFKGQQVAAEAGVKKAEIAAQNKLEVEALKTHLLQGTASRFMPDVGPNGERFYRVFNKFGKEIGRADVNAIPQFTGKTTSTYELKQQEDGSYIRIPKVTQNFPILPNKGSSAPGAGGVSSNVVNKGGKNYWATSDTSAGVNRMAAVPVLGADGKPVFGKAPENIRTMAYTAQATLPHIPDLLQEIDDLDKQGLLGEFKGKWTKLLASKGFAVPGLTAEQRQLVGRFVNDVGLMDSAMLRTHFGARGGQQMYDKFSQMLNAGEDVDLMKGGLSSFQEYLTGYGDMINQQTRAAGGGSKPKPAANTGGTQRPPGW